MDQPCYLSMIKVEPAIPSAVSRMLVDMALGNTIVQYVVLLRASEDESKTTSPVCKLLFTGLPILKEAHSARGRRHASSTQRQMFFRIIAFFTIFIEQTINKLLCDSFHRLLQISSMYPSKIHIYHYILESAQLIILLITSIMHIKSHQDEQEPQQIKGSFTAGKIIKGTVNEASTKLRVASIPKKHENIIYATSSTTGFGASLRQGLPSFTHQVIQPGPGFYQAGDGQKKTESKKGNGFFASQSKLTTLQRFKSQALGPGSYMITNDQKKEVRESQKNKSRTIGHQLFKTELQVSISKPGVGSYNLQPQRISRNHSLPAFKSKVSRFQQLTEKSPPVGLYEPPQILLNKKSYSKNPQQGQKKWHEKENQRQKLIQKAIKSVVGPERARNNLGPGSYNPSLGSGTKSFKISDNMYDRFGQLKPIFIMAKTFENEKKTYGAPQIAKKSQKKTDATFKSATKKWEIELSNQMDPGKYNSQKSPTKVSHLINFTRNWI